MKKQLRTIRFLTVLLLVSMLLITGCRSTKPGGKGGDNGNGDPQLPGYTGMEVVKMAESLGLGWDDRYPETVTVGGDEITLADAVYLMAKVLEALADSGATNVEGGVSGKLPDFVPYKQIALPNTVTQGKMEGVITWENIFASARQMVNTLDANPQIPDEITVLWHPSGLDWAVVKTMDPEEQTVGINILISCYARMITYASNNNWQFANWATIKGGVLPDSWPQQEGD